jgi:hypothetical protein
VEFKKGDDICFSDHMVNEIVMKNRLAIRLSRKEAMKMFQPTHGCKKRRRKRIVNQNIFTC